ncbi:uncharacterized protein LOC106072720 [Biomphalaria glabrata]|uniref:Uncharacterized protein LOC106072720 n=1 Tax=Biomphalaria glabrata TaxID=6526 RepID=A0A9W3A3M4_BIOGL|nr:uncharacterized protein LOC106072720 [Biomphalaria glabrata]
MLTSPSTAQLAAQSQLQIIRKKSFTNLWEWFGKEETCVPPSIGAGRPTAKDVWRPRRCHTKGPLYEFHVEEVSVSQDNQVQLPPPLTEVSPSLPKVRVKICPICRRVPVDPVTLECGHLFCRLCIAKIRPVLFQDFAESIKDHRTMIRCPFPSCQYLMPVRPIVNGDFRFNKIHPDDRVQVTEIPLCELEALRSFRVSVDIDFTKKYKSDIFGGFLDI